jgi:hypothetical protein
VVIQAGEDGAEGVVAQRLRRPPVPASAAAAAAAATAPLRGEASAPAPAAACLHLRRDWSRATPGLPAGGRPVQTVGL